MSLLFKKFQSPSPHLRSSRRWNGMKIGLLGGSFNPPHKGHMHIAQTALRQHGFHAIWWMVSPQNPLKSSTNNFAKRMMMTQKHLRNQPRMIATDIETQLDTQYSYHTVTKLQKHFPSTKFTWIAGMDNARIFHRWDYWRALLKKIPFIFFNRPPNSMAMNTNAIRLYRGQKNVKWSLQGKTRNISSTSLRQNRIARFFKSKL
jgi:nicotinate-nucleotide adenylyltransferase